VDYDDNLLPAFAVGRYGAASWELVEANECGKDTYYIRNIDEGEYLSSKPDTDRQYAHFQDDQSMAAVVRLKRYHRDLEEWRRNLKIGSEIFLRVFSHGDPEEKSRVYYPQISKLERYPKEAAYWFRARVIATKQTGFFEREIKLEYGEKRDLYVNKSGLEESAEFIGTYASPESRFPEWVPIGNRALYNIEEVMEQQGTTSNLVHLETPPPLKGVVRRYNVRKGFGFISCDDGSGDVYVHFSAVKAKGFKTLGEGEKVEFKMVLRKDGRRKATNVTGPDGAFVIGYQGGGYNRGRGYSRGGSVYPLIIQGKERVDRISEERVESRHKKKWKKRKRGNYKKRNERIMRESQQKQRNQKRKCGRRSKYALCY